MGRAYRYATLVLSLAVLTGCNREEEPASPTPTGHPEAAADPLAANDAAPSGLADSEARPLMQVQIVLDRLGFAPGVIDGREGLSTRNALSAFQEANGLESTGQLDPATVAALAPWTSLPATRIVAIPASFAAGPFRAVPSAPADQARLTALGYASLDEKLAERFHTTVETLRLLNPEGAPASPQNPPLSPRVDRAGDVPPPDGPYFRAGQTIRVPNVGNDSIDPARLDGDRAWQDTLTALGVGTRQPRVDRIVVSKAKGTLKAFDGTGRLVAAFTVTTGSEHDPLPLGEWKINGISRNPTFHYNPALFWDASPGDRKATLPPGPNGPVGVVWIDLSKPHYGIHGTPHPDLIGRTESHGCVRLTNWDAARLALMVHAGTKVLFRP